MSRGDGPYACAVAFTRHHRLFRPGDRVLVGVGHAASVGLLGFLARAREVLGLAEVAGAAVEHTTDEGSDAAEEVADAGRLVRQLGLTFLGTRPAVVPGARVHVVRELVALAEEQGFDRVALGHTREDDALAVLTQIVKGRGLAGVTGLVPRRRDGVVRPLLALSLVEAVSLANAMVPAVQPRTEETRRTLSSELAMVAVPRLRALVPDVEEALARVGRDARRLHRKTGAEAKRLLDAARQPDGSLDLPVLSGGGELAGTLARDALRALAGRRATQREVECLARILSGAGTGKEATLLAGIVVTLMPERAVVHLRIVAMSQALRGVRRRGTDG